MSEYPWYSAVSKDEPLNQGDFLKGCPLIVPVDMSAGFVEGKRTVDVELFDVVVMTQSCDLVPANPKVDIVLVCPYAELSQFVGTSHFMGQKKYQEEARKGNQPGFHILNSCTLPGFEFNMSYVALKDIYGVNIGTARALAQSTETRLRLMPPYREHLSQAFARLFMRVGLPQDIPKFE